MRGLDPTHKGHRMANYIVTLRKELLWLARACGVPHPSLVSPQHLEILDGRFGGVPAREVFHYEASWGMPSAEDQATIRQLMSAQ